MSGVEVHFSRIDEKHSIADVSSVAGHQRAATDSVQVNAFGSEYATVWCSFAGSKMMLVGKIDGVTYHSEGAQHGGWTHIIESIVRSPVVRHCGDLTALSLVFDVVNDDLDQYRAIYTWTAREIQAGYCTPQSWTWTWLPNPRSQTAIEVQKIVFPTKEEETSGA